MHIDPRFVFDIALFAAMTTFAFALDFAQAVEEPVALDLQDLRHPLQLLEVGVAGAPAHDVVDEGAVHAGHFTDLDGAEAELPAAGAQSVCHGL